MAYIPKSIKFQGDIDVLPHLVTSDGGTGNLRVADQLFVQGTEAVSGPQTGAVQIAGGTSIGGGGYINEGFTVNGSTSAGTSLGVDSDTVVPLSLKNRNSAGLSCVRFLDSTDFEQMVISYSNSTGTSAIQSNSSTLSIYANGNANQLRFNTDGTLYVSSTAPSTSTGSGSVKFAGGIGVADAVYQNFGSSTTGYASDNGSTAQGSMHYRLMTGGVNRFAISLAGTETGSDLVGSDLSILSYGSTGVFAGTLMRMTRSGITSFPSTIASTSKTTGSVVFAGGVGISGATYASTIDATDVTFSNVQANGTLRVKSTLFDSSNNNDLMISTNGDSLYLRNTQASTSGQILSSLANFVFFNTLATPSAALTIEKSTSNVTVHSTTISSSTTSGALHVNGGIGCAGSIFATGLNATSLSTTTITNTGSLDTGTLVVNDTTAASSTTAGAAVVLGGLAVAKKTYIQALAVPGLSTLSSTTIDTSNAALSITGVGGIDSNTAGNVSFVSASGDVDISATVGELSLISSGSSMDMTNGIDIASAGAFDIVSGASSAVTVTGSYTLSPSGKAIINAGSSASDAISLTTTNASGGVSVTSGTTGFSVTSTGKFDIESTAATSRLIHTQTGSSQNLNIGLEGTGTSILSMSSTGSTANAMDLYSSVGGMRLRGTTSMSISATGGTVSIGSPAATGPMTITQTATATSQGLAIALQGAFANVLSLTSAGTGANALNFVSTVGGITQTATSSWTTSVTSGPFSLTSTSSSLIQQTSSADGMDFTIGLAGVNAGTSRMILSSTGLGDDGLKLVSSSGGCDIQAISKISGVVSAGSVSFTGRAATGSAFTHKATGAGQDMHVGILQDGTSPATNSRLVLDAFGTGSDAVFVNAASGGVKVSGTGPITIDTSASSGILIGTTNPGIPVTLGNATSSVVVNDSLTVNGNFQVAGMISIFDSQVMTVTDSTLVLHSGPSGTSDSGILTERFQQVDLNTGDIVTDTFNETGFCQSGSTDSTIVLNGTTSAVADFYKDWWVKIVQGVGNGQIRKIKSYTPGSHTAIIYTNGELNGLNWATVPDSTSKYELYGHTYAALYYAESTDYYDFIYTNKDPVVNSYFNITGRPQVRMGSLRLDNTLLVDTISPMNNAGINMAGLVVTNGTIAGVVSINGASVPQEEVVTLVDNTTSEITITSSNLTGSFSLIVESVEPNGPTGNFSCSKSSAGTSGQANRLSFSKGSQNEVIDVTYTANNKAKLKYSKAPGDSLTHGFYVKIFKR